MTGTTTTSSYDVGLVIPADFEATLKSGGQPQVSLYLNSTVSSQEALLQAAVNDYARTVVTPASPVTVVTSAVSRHLHPALPKLLLGERMRIWCCPFSWGPAWPSYRAYHRGEREKDATHADGLAGLIYRCAPGQGACGLSLPDGALDYRAGGSGVFAANVNVSLLLLFTVCGAVLALSVGLLSGTMLETAGSAGLLEAAAAFAFIIPAIFVPLLPYLGGSAIGQIIKVLPTYYVAEGVYHALNNTGNLTSNVVDVTVILGSALVLYVGTVWLLRRQAQVAAVI